MLTVEMRMPPLSSSKPIPRPPLSRLTWSTSRWMNVGIWCLAAASLGTSLVYMGTEEQPPSAAYTLDPHWAAMPPLGVEADADAPLLLTMPVCAICGQVETVQSLISAERPAGHKRIFQIRVRMENGHLQTVRVEKPLAVGTQVKLEHGVLRLPSA